MRGQGDMADDVAIMAEVTTEVEGRDGRGSPLSWVGREWGGTGCLEEIGGRERYGENPLPLENPP